MVDKVGAKNAHGASELRPWSDLHTELLELIIGHLTITQRFGFDRVCKRWSSIVRAIPRPNGLSYGLPCSVSISYDGKVCTLVDPFRNEMHIKCKNLPSSCIILCSKSGWLLLLQSEPCAKERRRGAIFFFNPLTQTRIDLPNFKRGIMDVGFAFSTPPDSTDCMVVAIGGFSEDYVNIFFCKRGQNEWTEFLGVANQIPFKMSHVSPVLFNGRFYFLGDNGRLGVFDPHNNNWTVQQKPSTIKALRPEQKGLYVEESDGELMMFFADEYGKWVRIYKLDHSTTQWKGIDTIGDRTLLVSHKTSICSRVDGLISNAIYFPRIKDGVCMYYDCQDHKLHPGGNFHGSATLYWSFWIDPVWFQPSHEEQLKWSK